MEWVSSMSLLQVQNQLMLSVEPRHDWTTSPPAIKFQVCIIRPMHWAEIWGILLIYSVITMTQLTCWKLFGTQLRYSNLKTMIMECTKWWSSKESSVLFLLMIDLNPSDMTCVISTLWYIEKDAARYGVTTIVTFDQPFWWKAMLAIESELTLWKWTELWSFWD